MLMRVSNSRQVVRGNGLSSSSFEARLCAFKYVKSAHIACLEHIYAELVIADKRPAANAYLLELFIWVVCASD